MKLKLFWFLFPQCPQPCLSLLERERAKERLRGPALGQEDTGKSNFLPKMLIVCYKFGLIYGIQITCNI